MEAQMTFACPVGCAVIRDPELRLFFFVLKYACLLLLLKGVCVLRL